MSADKKGTELELIVVLQSGITIEGTINMIDFTRFSDFIEKDPLKHIKLYNAKKTAHIKAAAKNFLLIPKRSVDWYEPREPRN
jgi:hypothetical protein